MATHSSILAWRIPWMEEPGGLKEVKESDTTERLHFTILSTTIFLCILQSCIYISTKITDLKISV